MIRSTICSGLSMNPTRIMNFEELTVFIVADDDLCPEYTQLRADLEISKVE